MSHAARPAQRHRLLKRADLLFTGGLFGTVLLLILPVPAFCSTCCWRSTSALAARPARDRLREGPAGVLRLPHDAAALTLFRLALNISSTRSDPGARLRRPHHRLVRPLRHPGQLHRRRRGVLILVVINFVVITKGAGRIAEVSARFTLDALPGKQMAIDAELNAGIIDEVTATARRVKVQKEADFYGAMDGASKFVRGDAIAGIIITLVNIIGGFRHRRLPDGPLARRVAAEIHAALHR
jgi:flagellar biosynthesis protein FlhA